MTRTEDSRAISPIEEIIEEARNGRMFILVDAEDRENEGDLVIPGQFATPEQVNFMARHGRGLICLALPDARARDLGLQLMSPANGTRHQTAFTVSIEAAEGVSTGISAHDRARTIAVAIDPGKSAADIVTPGHVFPLVARDGGTLARAGHTEASVDIARLAGLNPSGVICEIMNDDGTMARLPDLIAFAQLHGLKIGTIEDLIAYRRRTERFVARMVETEATSQYGGTFRVVIYRNTLDGLEHIALVKGRIDADGATLVRMHRLDLAADVLGFDPRRDGLLQAAMTAVAESPDGGVVVLLREGMAAPLSERLQRMAEGAPAQPAGEALREYGTGAQILADLGVRDMVLLTGSDRRIVALDGYGLRVKGVRPLVPVNPE
jgi:3,4-dihydroxy 2-butanone 4-phosphate synthase / GTP cyclohydrolase II